MKRLCYVLLVISLCATTPKVHAQGDLNIFGYFQSSFSNSTPKNDFSGSKNHSFLVQQLNLMASKNLNDNFSAFINLEVVNSFSSERNWGGLNLEEAWVKYYHSDAFNLKAGLLIPRFNNLNEIKNRMPLLPYVIRPLVYEATISELIDIGDYVPERAYIQAYGFIPVGRAKFDYAAYVGNSEKSYVAAQAGGTVVRGNDTSTFKLVGGRIGASYGDFKIGVSATYDRENHNDTSASNFFKFGDVPRIRIGGDVSYSIVGFNLEGEIIMVRYSLSDEQEKVIDNINQHPVFKNFVGPAFEKNFYYGNLAYNITPELYAYAGYSYMDSKENPFWKHGFSALSAGAGYRPIDAVTVKAQYAKYKLNKNDQFDFETDFIYAAVSVFF